MPTPLPQEPLAVRAGRLKHTPLFSDASGEELRSVAGCCSLLAFEAGEAVVEQGAPADAFFIVVDGALEVRRRDEAGVETGLGGMYRGEFGGEMDLVDPGPRTATVVARTPATVMMLDRTDFDAVLNTIPAVRERLPAKVKARLYNHFDREKPSEEEVLGTLMGLFGGLPEEVARSGRSAEHGGHRPAGG